MTLTLRAACADDVPLLLDLIRQLARYERLETAAVATPALLERHLFGPTPRAHALLAEEGDKPCGFALWFFSFSTFTGRPTLFVEDVFVHEASRGRGIGRAIFAELARRAVAAECARMEWSVLDWNEPAIGFYRSIGAEGLNDWTVQRLAGGSLLTLAGEAHG